MVLSWKSLVSFAMGSTQSKDIDVVEDVEDVEDVLYQQVINGEIEEIEALHKQGATLEWCDREGKTPLIVACMDLQLYEVAKTLLELGADVNAYCPGFHAGTALHHAAEKGLERTVELLLSQGANALATNDNLQTPLEIARVKGHTNVVRTIESHICFFSGWVRELNGPGFLDALVPQFLSRKIWVVVIPSYCHSPAEPYEMELAMYASLQDCQPRTSIALQNAEVKDPKFDQSTPLLSIFDKATETRYKFTSSDKNVKQQLQWLCNACRGIPQIVPLTSVPASHCPISGSTPPSNAEDVELAIAINASLLSAAEERSPIHDSHLSSDSTTHEVLETDPIPSAPPVPEDADYGPIHYPSIDLTPVDLSMPNMHSKETTVKDNAATSSPCVMCLDAPVEGACVPCGHMVGCMSCLKEIKAKKGVCPICCSKIDQTIRLYAA